jgi:hypothetical protein
MFVQFCEMEKGRQTMCAKNKVCFSVPKNEFKGSRQ